jgi:hypothetical protein
MPTALISFKKTSDGHILFHGFLAPSENVAEKMQKSHADICPQYGPALKASETFDFSIDVDELPEFDEGSLGEWIDEMFGLDGDDEDEDDDIGGGPEDEDEDEDDDK